MLRRFGLIVALFALLSAACAGEDPGSSAPPTPDTSAPPVTIVGGEVEPIDVDARLKNVTFRSTLQRLADCDSLLAHLRLEGSARVGPYGLGNGGYWGGPVPLTEDLVDQEFLERDFAAASFDEVSGTIPDARLTQDGGDAGASTGDGAVSEQVFSGTNVQELGIDEPDIIKTDGNRVVTLTDNVVHVIDVTGERAEIIHQIRLDGDAWGQDLLMVGDTLLVFRQGQEFGVL